MIIRKYDIELHRLTRADIELVRQHRNSQAISSKMFYQNTISKEAQEKWFDGINNTLNYYFIVVWKGKKVGLINGTILSQEKGISTGGVFFWDENVLKTYIPICASIIMGDLTFLLLGMKKTTAVVRSDNKVALQFNEKLGYNPVKKEDNKMHMELLETAYLDSKVRGLIRRITKDDKALEWSDVEVSDTDLDNGNILPDFMKKYKY